MSQVDAETYEGVLTVANAIQLSVNVTSKIAGNDVADTVDGETLNTTLLTNIYAAKVAGYIKGEG
jgi:hypothetical protein